MQAWIQHSHCSLFKCSKKSEENFLWGSLAMHKFRGYKSNGGVKNTEKLYLSVTMGAVSKFQSKVSNQNF